LFRSRDTDCFCGRIHPYRDGAQLSSVPEQESHVLHVLPVHLRDSESGVGPGDPQRSESSD
jgi:hypothetical protein